VHALPFTTHTETLVEEDLVRGLRFSSNFAKQYGLELPTDAKMTDVPCHSWFLPTLLAHSGITLMHEGTNSGSGDPDVPLLYFREGPDGSRVLTMHVDGYGSGIDPPNDWPYQTWLGLIHTGDNHGPPRAEEIEELFRQCAERYPGVAVRIGRLSDFGNAILAQEDLSKIPVVTGDMPDTWIHGPMCDPQGQALARAVHEQLTATEILGTLYRIHAKERGNFPTAQEMADAREQSLLYGEHTWGAALAWILSYNGGELPFGDAWKELWQSKNFSESQKRAMQSWEDHTDYIRNAAKVIDATIKPYSIPFIDPSESPVFNPLSWNIVTEGGQTLAPGEQAIHRKQLAISHPFPPITKTIESPFFRLTFDGKEGKITSLYDMKNNRELIQQEEAQPLGLLYQRASAAMCDAFMNDYCISFPSWVLNEFNKRGLPNNVPEQRIVPKVRGFYTFIDSFRSENGICIGYESEYKDLPFSDLRLDITLSAHRPEVKFRFHGRSKAPDTWPEAGYFCFPLNIDSPQFRLGRLGGIVDPARDIVPGSNRHLQWLRTGVAVFGEDGYGVGICPLDAPLVSLGEPGCWKFSKDYVPDKANVYFNLFNNQWTTNFRLWNEGNINASFVLWTFDEYDNESSLITPSLETLAINFPPTYYYLGNTGYAQLGNYPPLTGVRTNRKGMCITSFGDDPDTGKLMLRIWEMAGLGGDNPAVEVTLPPVLKAQSVIPCDLRGRAIGASIPVMDGVFQIDIKPYSPVNLHILPGN
ncbi:MAG: hypothetical protein FWD31_06040, partial [Planctomycetaceae bacterium]|nr:hypothetical protein [Planctomycetaceae bacterium]